MEKKNTYPSGASELNRVILCLCCSIVSFICSVLWVVVCQLLVLYVSDIVLPVCHSISCSIISILFVYSNFFLFSVALRMFLSF